MKIVLAFIFSVMTAISANAEWVLRPDAGFTLPTQTQQISCYIPGLAGAISDLTAFREALRSGLYNGWYTPYLSIPGFWDLYVQKDRPMPLPNVLEDHNDVGRLIEDYKNKCMVNLATPSDVDKKIEAFGVKHFENIKGLFESMPSKFTNDPATREMIKEVVREVVREELAKKNN